MGTSRQTKQIPVINNKRDRFGENKIKNNFAVSIQYSGLSRCANIFLKTDEFSLIKPGCSVHIVMDEDNKIYGVINNGLKPQKSGHGTNNKSQKSQIDKIIDTVTNTAHHPRIKRAFVGYVVHGERPKSTLKSNLEIQKMSNEWYDTLEKRTRECIDIQLCCSHDNLLQ